MRYGLSMFGLNPLFLQDKEGFLKRMSAAGYRYLEPCIMEEPIPQFADRFWTPADWDAYQPMLEKYGMQVYSIHVFPRDLAQEMPGLLALAKKHGASQLVAPCPAFTSAEEGHVFARQFTAAAEAARNEGMELLLHNAKEASEARVEGFSAYEWLLQHCGDAVFAQADVGWLLYGGTDPESFLWRNKDRIRSLHYKDMEKTPEGMVETGIGRGLVDMLACFQFARAVEIIQLADQDSSRGDFLEDMEYVANRFRSLTGERERTKSILCILDTETGEVTQLKTFNKVIEAPNWLQTDDDALIFNADGHIYRYRISTGSETEIPSGHCDNCNNDHVLSPDNTQIAVSHSEHGWMSQIYILPIEGGEPKLITPNAPSYLHGWSPEGKELAYCAFRDHGKGYEVDIYAIPADGGEEKQLTRNAGFNDGPEYSPNGNHIWFISTRSGLMQCWRMNRDGSEPTQMTFRERNNWFPHVSPDGKQVVYLSYSRDGLDPNEHLPNMQVALYLMDYDGGNDRLLLEFFGGQGSINVNSWSRDSRRLAFVMYELEHK